MRARCRGEEDGLDGPTLCKEILSVLDTRNFGFCKSTTLKPSKEGGYVQLSYGGANKICSASGSFAMGWGCDASR